MSVVCIFVARDKCRVQSEQYFKKKRSHEIVICLRIWFLFHSKSNHHISVGRSDIETYKFTIYAFGKNNNYANANAFAIDIAIYLAPHTYNIIGLSMSRLCACARNRVLAAPANL